MRIKWLGHASFLITSDSGTRLITDPFTTGAQSGFSYGEIKESADIVTVSHGHPDHNNVASIIGNPQIVRGAADKEIKGIKIKGIPSYHDEAGGKKRGENTIFCFELDGVRVCHLGDLGHLLNDKQVAEIGEVDILFVPVGGYFTIDSKAATSVCSQLKPRVIIPMHWNLKWSFPEVGSVDEFLKGKADVNHSDNTEIEFKSEGLPTTTKIFVLKPTL